MKHRCWKGCEELHDEIMSTDVRDLALLLRGRRASDFQEVLNDLHGDILSVVVGKLIVVHKHEQSSCTHQLKLLVPSVLTVLVLNDFDELGYGFVVAMWVGFHHALLQLSEVQRGG